MYSVSRAWGGGGVGGVEARPSLVQGQLSVDRECLEDCEEHKFKKMKTEGEMPEIQIAMEQPCQTYLQKDHCPVSPSTMLWETSEKVKISW